MGVTPFQVPKETNSLGKELEQTIQNISSSLGFSDVLI